MRITDLLKNRVLLSALKLPTRAKQLTNLFHYMKSAETSRMLKPTKRESSTVKNSAQQP